VDHAQSRCIRASVLWVPPQWRAGMERANLIVVSVSESARTRPAWNPHDSTSPGRGRWSNSSGSKK